jgi:DNA-binding PucR family transcriptional regulator
MSEEDSNYWAHKRLDALIESMKALIEHDSEQEVRGIALEVVDAAIAAVKAVKPDDPVVAATSALFSADLIASGEGVRAADLLVVAQQLEAALDPYISGF